MRVNEAVEWNLPPIMFLNQSRFAATSVSDFWLSAGFAALRSNINMLFCSYYHYSRFLFATKGNKLGFANGINRSTWLSNAILCSSNISLAIIAWKTMFTIRHTHTDLHEYNCRYTKLVSSESATEASRVDMNSFQYQGVFIPVATWPCSWRHEREIHEAATGRLPELIMW